MSNYRKQADLGDGCMGCTWTASWLFIFFLGGLIVGVGACGL